MKIYTSYFYMVRFFKKNEIPLSTACWNPKWFNEFLSQNHTFIDKRGIVNGLKYQPFVPNSSCNGLCRGPEVCKEHPPNDDCAFLHRYREQLSKIPKEQVLKDLAELSAKWQKKFETDVQPDFVFLFHETPHNPCSERWAVQDWFGENGIECKEYEI